jgi:predicted PilT family ATPase
MYVRLDFVVESKPDSNNKIYVTVQHTTDHILISIQTHEQAANCLSYADGCIILHAFISTMGFVKQRRPLHANAHIKTTWLSCFAK